MTDEPRQAEAVRALLRDAAQHLSKARGLLLGPAPEYAAGVAASVRVIRQALRAFTLWHSLPAPEDASLSSLARRAVPLASILETPVQRALPLEALEAELRGKKAFTVYEREAAQTSYYTARNVFFTVLGLLPERVQQTARPASRPSPKRGEPDRAGDAPARLINDPESLVSL